MITSKEIKLDPENKSSIELITVDKDKESIDYIRIRKLLRKNDFLHDRNNEISNKVYKKEYKIKINLRIWKNVSTNSIINYEEKNIKTF